MPTALITGITGQDGSYLAEHLLDLGYRVVGVTRRSSTDTGSRTEHLRDRIELASGDLFDQTSLLALVDRVQPDEVYNLAARRVCRLIVIRSPKSRVTLRACFKTPRRHVGSAAWVGRNPRRHESLGARSSSRQTAAKGF
jgi:GDP-D-mannose dehydratase